MIPYRLHTMPSKESMRLQWANTLNRKSLSKQVFACSEHFLDGKPTERNPNFGDTVSESYKNSLHVFVDVIHKNLFPFI
jgi:hypothetical protein